MSLSQWLLIAGLAAATFATRLLGYLAGDRLRQSRFAFVLEDLPGLIVVALVASSLAGTEPKTWIAAALAVAIAWVSNNVVVTMSAGLAAYLALGVVIT
ncbi:AzlD domain-containing protein [Afifella marina]|uniref:Branched-chain amino acid transport protein n=1 Tax=Afifella marina DSM 2698 TaxID=1120955 RepID=A0A1G5MFK1_AFIMA|nr:AzlD domain-containing protein [Afifella marina]MBK1625198.1 branched-chain amino acid transporter [Afifella marina DSM 2698]MBK1628915.1 branched-chain amino acid transporter [Afifella marina]MBK5918294.1 branched-chain amino acid transporter [Afifella marina]RAI22813.1 branched-chain amino acid transporter [Afifella marina DSM 2698]SCZ23926.1 Branched-chain amino acid transport protein [Afifella marina DSM 2698]